MPNVMLDRLETAIDRLLEKNRQQDSELLLLRQEKATWRRERQQLLADLDKVIERLDELQAEDS